MKATVFLEGSPGHEKQSLAIIEALQNIVDLNVEKINVEKKTTLRRAIEAYRYFLLADGGCEYTISDSDFIIGTGSRTHIPMLSCKKKYNVPVVTCMTPDILIRKNFDLCFVPRHDGLEENGNIVLTDGPPVYKPASGNRNEKSGLILIGGIDHSNHEWSDAEIAGYIIDIVEENLDICWVVSSSPRTPQTTVDMMLKLECRSSNVKFYNYRDTPSGWVEEQYASAKYVWVTADSVSMVYEAITAGCKVGILPVVWKRKNNKFQKSLSNLYSRNLAAPYGKGVHTDFIKVKGSFNEANRCAREILSRIG